MKILVKICILIMALSSTAAATLTNDMPALQALFTFFSGGEYKNGTQTKDTSQMTLEELGVSRGQCLYDFQNYISYRDLLECAPDDQYILHLFPTQYALNANKPPIMVKCIETELPANATANDSTLLMMTSVKDILALLKPIGNATKRHEPGSCVLILFYTETSLACAHIAPYANALPRLFPTLRIAAVDALEFPIFNTDFGIVGLPTLLLFHQGRPIVKFYSDVGTFAAFVTRHTGIKPVTPVPGAEEVQGPLPLTPRQETDYMLFVAWGFILICVGKYFGKTRLGKHIVDIIKRYWRESEAQADHN